MTFVRDGIPGSPAFNRYRLHKRAVHEITVFSTRNVSVFEAKMSQSSSA